MHPDVRALVEHDRLHPLPAEGTRFTSTYTRKWTRICC